MTDHNKSLLRHYWHENSTRSSRPKNFYHTKRNALLPFPTSSVRDDSEIRDHKHKGSYDALRLDWGALRNKRERQSIIPTLTYIPPRESEDTGENKDFLLRLLGDVGNWQVIIVIIMTLFNIPTVFQVSSPEVTGAKHESWCSKPTYLANISKDDWKNISGVWKIGLRGERVFDPCWKKDLPYDEPYHILINYKTSKKKRCDTWNYAEGQNSIISQFNLACTKMPVNNLAESMFSFGGIFGDVINGVLSDRYGRRRVLMISQGLVVLTGFIIASAPSYNVYLFCRIILGYLCSAITLCSFVICVEILGGKWRGILTTVYMLSYSLGYLSLHFFSTLLNVWTHLQYSITFIAIFLLSIWWLVPESPRWLLTIQNLPKLMITLETASSFNRQPLLPGTPAQLKKTMPMRNKELKPATLSQLFESRIIKQLSVVGPFPLFFCNLTYYGMVINNDLSINGLFVSGLSELVAVAFVLLLKVTNELKLVIISIILAGVCCLLASGFTNGSGNTLEIVCLFARFFGGMMNTTLTTIVACTYPTAIRTTGLGWCHCFANIAVFLAANIVLLSNVFAPLPFIILGISALFGGISLMFLPNRISFDLMDLIEEVEAAEIDSISHSPIRYQSPETSQNESETAEVPSYLAVASDPTALTNIYMKKTSHDKGYGKHKVKGKGLVALPPHSSNLWRESTPQAETAKAQALAPTPTTTPPRVVPTSDAPDSKDEEPPPEIYTRSRSTTKSTINEDADIPYHCVLI